MCRCGADIFLYGQLSVLFWRKPGIFFKDLRKIALIFKSCCDSNIYDGVIRICQQTLTLLNAHHIQVLLKRGADRLLEDRGKISRI